MNNIHHCSTTCHQFSQFKQPCRYPAEIPKITTLQTNSRTDLRATSEVTEGLGQRGGGPQPLQPLELLGWASAGSLRSFPGWLPRYAAGQRKLGTHEVATET